LPKGLRVSSNAGAFDGIYGRSGNSALPGYGDGVLIAGPVDVVDATGVGPVFGALDEAGAHGVFTDVLPFLRVAFAMPQPVVKAAVLKGAGVRVGFREAVFPEGDPAFDGEV